MRHLQPLIIFALVIALLALYYWPKDKPKQYGSVVLTIEKNVIKSDSLTKQAKQIVTRYIDVSKITPIFITDTVRVKEFIQLADSTVYQLMYIIEQKDSIIFDLSQIGIKLADENDSLKTENKTLKKQRKYLIYYTVVDKVTDVIVLTILKK